MPSGSLFGAMVTCLIFAGACRQETTSSIQNATGEAACPENPPKLLATLSGQPAAALRLDDSPPDLTHFDIDVDLRSFSHTPLNQGQLGSCQTFSVVSLAEIALRKQGIDVSISPAQLWSDASGRTQGNFEEMQTLLQNRVVVSSQLWPYTPDDSPLGIAGPLTPITPAAYIAVLNGYEMIDEMAALTRLKEGLPSSLGLFVNKSWTPCASLTANGRIDSDGQAWGGPSGHITTLVGAKSDSTFGGGGYFIIKNSWGTEFGDKGYAYVPFDYCVKNDHCEFRKLNQAFPYDASAQMNYHFPAPYAGY